MKARARKSDIDLLEWGCCWVRAQITNRNPNYSIRNGLLWKDSRNLCVSMNWCSVVSRILLYPFFFDFLLMFGNFISRSRWRRRRRWTGQNARPIFFIFLNHFITWWMKCRIFLAHFASRRFQHTANGSQIHEERKKEIERERDP